MDWLNETIFIITTGTNSDDTTRAYRSVVRTAMTAVINDGIVYELSKSCDGWYYTLTLRNELILIHLFDLSGPTDGIRPISDRLSDQLILGKEMK